MKKIKPGSFVDRAIAKANFNNDKRIILKDYWAGNDDTELSPDKVASLSEGRAVANKSHAIQNI
jgi:hypothetical protein